MTKAKKAKFEPQDEEIKEAINIASGTFVAPLADTIYAISENENSLLIYAQYIESNFLKAKNLMKQLNFCI